MSSAKKTYDGKIAGLYDLEETLGRGHFAVVKLARHVFTGEKVAVKVIDKTKLDDVSRAHLFQEVRCMKLVQHPNVVRLYEVIDTQTKLYLILELGDGGDLYDYIMKHESGLEEDMAKEYFRQIVRAISYCHQLHVVHRDLKPENVVFFERLGIVKLTDFGFSNKFCPGQKLDTSCGSLAYSAPEILLGDSYDAPAVDVWSLGVILYMLVVGQAPFQEANDSETLTMIMDCKYTIPVRVSEACKCLIAKMLVREPESRAKLQDIASDPWLGGSSQVEYLPLVSRHQMTEEDHNIIINKMVNGNIATKEEVLEALDRNEYNHITATYFLLAERKLKTYRQEQAQSRLKQNLALVNLSTPSKNSLAKVQSADSATSDSLQMSSSTTILSIPRNLEETTQGKVRKCSIVQEEEDEEEYCSVAGNSQELTPPHSSLNRRGSRSEGKLCIAVQERIAEERRKEIKESSSTSPNKNNFSRISSRNDIIRPNKWASPTSKYSGVSTAYIPGFGIKRINHGKALTENPPGETQLDCSNYVVKLENENSYRMVKTDSEISNPVKENECKEVNSRKSMQKAEVGENNNSSQIKISANSQMDINIENSDFTAVSLKDSATITIPFYPASDKTSLGSKFRTFPSPSKNSSSVKTSPFKGVPDHKTTADECLFFGDNRTNRNGINNMKCEQRKNKFHKARTASCSSSDASDDDSESRKKRAHKISFEKINQRKDSHDDSNDSHDRRGNGGGVNSTSGLDKSGGEVEKPNQTNNSRETGSNGSGDRCGESNNQRKCNGENFRRSRRHTGETRLRESQSLNRIMEVQETEANNYSFMNFEVFQEKLRKTDNSSNYTTNFLDKPKLNKSFGARFLQSWSSTLSSKKLPAQKKKYLSSEKHNRATSDTRISEISEQLPKHYSDEKENKTLLKETGKKSKGSWTILSGFKKIMHPSP